tara:strand:+ start:658 stop:870 length:213 start_codon:yes stop_codon:yes gene_type:complete
MASISETFLGLPLAIVINGLDNDRFINLKTILLDKRTYLLNEEDLETGWVEHSTPSQRLGTCLGERKYTL